VESTSTVTVDQDNSQTFMSGFPGSDLTCAPYVFDPNHPILAKLFCSDVVTDVAGEFVVRVATPYGTLQFHRLDSKDFGFVFDYKKNWNNLGALNVTVSAQPLGEMSEVSFQAMVGLSNDGMNLGVA
jgi:hypothetical protein